MEQERERDANQQPQTDQDEHEQEKVVYVYPLEGGGLVFTEPPLEENDQQPEAPIVDAKEPERDTRPTAHKDLPYFLHFLLVLLLFVSLDNLDTVFAQRAPTVTVTIMPAVKTISTTATLTVGGAGAEVSERILAPLTLSQMQTVNASGHGHQDATRATGTLTFYNGSFSSQTIYAGTVYTGSDSVQVATNETVTIPAANPPYVGQATVSASAIIAGANGNIQAGDISITTNALQVRNNQFHNGQDARDFTTVSKEDIDQPAATLKAQVAQSMQAALQGQVKIGEQFLSLPCSPTTTADHEVGDEALQVHITVSESCTALTYDTQQLTTLGTARLTAQAAKILGIGYKLHGNVTVSMTKVTTTDKKNVVLLSFTCQGTWVDQINEARIKALVTGKPRLTALHILSTVSGVQSVSIAGVSDNQPLPSDPAHIHLLMLVEE